MSESFSFAVITDPHCGEKPHGQSAETQGSHIDRFMRCFELLEQMPENRQPDFVLVLGDIHLWALGDDIERIPYPLHVIAGNHEPGVRKAEMRALFPEDFRIDDNPSDYYSFVHKGVRFIGVCNAGGGGEHIGQLASEDFGPRGQCEWLEGELRAAEPDKIVFAHIPPDPESRDVPMYMSRNDAIFFNRLVSETGPRLALFGHMHSDTREFLIGNTRAIILRSCAWNFFDAPLGFLHITIHDGDVDIEEIITY